MHRYELIFLDADETLFDFRRGEGFALSRAFGQWELELSDGAFRDYDAINSELWSRLERGEIDQRKLRSERFRLLFEYACDALDFHGKEKMLMIGDSLSSDIEGGINFGIDTCWVNSSRRENSTKLHPTYEVRNLAEIRDLL